MKATLILIVFFFLHCGNSFAQKTPAKTAADSLRYLALGDSYTAGYLVPKQESFPYQLAKALTGKGLKTGVPLVIAHNGWNTRQLLDAVSAQKPKNNFDIVTLFIGVNNQYRGYSLPDYERDMTQLVKETIRFAAKNKQHVFVIGIPDWSITPFGADKNPQQMALEIADFNAINKKVSEKNGVNFIDMILVSRQMQNQPDAVASDKLHPTAKTYALWVAEVLKRIQKNFPMLDK